MLEVFKRKSEEGGLSIFKDPFNARCVQNIHIHIYMPGRDSSFGGTISEGSFSASVGFKNGDTEGEQSIQAESYDGLINKIEAFINEVK